MRLFASVRPPVAVLDHLRAALDLTGLGASPDVPLRRTAEETWHLTVAFFGEVPDGTLPELEDLLAEAAAGRPAFELRLRGAGVFSGRTVWVGAGGDVAAMAGLAAAARDAGEQVSRYRDGHERVRPHLTVARTTADPRGARPDRRGRDGRHLARPGGPDRDRERGRDRDRDRARRPEPGPVDALVHALALYEGPTWTVDELLLEQSWPGRGPGGGPLYERVARWPLPAVAG